MNDNQFVALWAVGFSQLVFTALIYLLLRCRETNRSCSEEEKWKLNRP